VVLLAELIIAYFINTEKKKLEIQKQQIQNSVQQQVQETINNKENKSANSEKNTNPATRPAPQIPKR